MQQTLLLTFKGTKHTLDLEVPGDVAVSNLLPFLLRLCGDSEDGGKWLVSRQTSGRPLQAANTLFENKVLDGEILLLHKEGTPVEVLRPKRQAVPATYAQRGSIMVTWER